MWGLGFRVRGLGFGVWGLGGLGFGVWGLGFRGGQPSLFCERDLVFRALPAALPAQNSQRRYSGLRGIPSPSTTPTRLLNPKN